jgi:glutamate--cysteine ligase
MRDAVPAAALATPFRNTTLREIAREVLAISRRGLAVRGCLNDGGNDETGFLAPLDEVVARGTTSAQDMLNAFDTRWNGSVEPAFVEYAY